MKLAYVPDFQHGDLYCSLKSRYGVIVYDGDNPLYVRLEKYELPLTFEKTFDVSKKVFKQFCDAAWVRDKKTVDTLVQEYFK